MSGNAPRAQMPKASDGATRPVLLTVLRLAASVASLAALRAFFRRDPRAQSSAQPRPGAEPPKQAEPPLEAASVATWPVLFTVVGFFVFVGLSLVGLRAYYAWDVRGPVVTPPRSFAEPRLQADPKADLNRFQAEQRQRLTGYAWVDRSQGIVRIPIGRAMDLIAARGVEAYAPLDPPAEPSPLRSPEKRP